MVKILNSLARQVVPLNARFRIRTSKAVVLPLFFIELFKRKNRFLGHSKEDSKLAELLDEDNGTYIDIGSGRPISGSNTFYFYRKGWKGILIDPLTTNRILSQFLRPRDKFIQGVISENPDFEIPFWEFYPYGNSTTVQELAEKQEKKLGFYLVRKVNIKNIPIKSLAPLMMENLTLLSIDTEGRDFEILQGLDFSIIKPKVICVEAWTKNEENEIAGLLFRNGYFFTGRFGNSIIFHRIKI